MRIDNLIRYKFLEDRTIGKYFINNEFAFYTLEDAARVQDVKIYGKTCIPAGVYNLRKRFSPSFNRNLPIVSNQPDRITLNMAGISFRYILIHTGNTPDHTSGCILVGSEYNADNNTVFNNGRDIENQLIEELSTNDITLVISNLSTYANFKI